MSVGGKKKGSAERQMSLAQSRKKKQQQKAINAEREMLGQMQKLADKLGAQLTVVDETIEKKLKKNLLH
jgi:hypothetical protein|tara:strand:+ start:313 stop:519 length:207 start_codon:yes stop_codon:yes gene_type:complete